MVAAGKAVANKPGPTPHVAPEPGAGIDVDEKPVRKFAVPVPVSGVTGTGRMTTTRR